MRRLALLALIVLAACGADGDPEPGRTPPPSTVTVTGSVTFGATL